MRGAGSPDSDVTTSDVAACQGSAAGAGRPVQQDLGRRGGRRACIHRAAWGGRQKLERALLSVGCWQPRPTWPL